jgi:protein tyrosine phosphatase (PTP) superfamily phosphohydrolase (DUF442 family)
MPRTNPPARAHPGSARRLGRWILRAVAVLAVTVIAGNLLISMAYALAVATRPDPGVEPIPGVTHTRRVDDRVLRGSAPAIESYEAMAARGITTVVDLRAERDLEIPDLTGLGLTRIALPVRDGQTPTPEQVRRFIDIVESSPGKVFVHCGAGVGRTGSMAAAYLLATGPAGRWSALRTNLGAGPPSLEQIWYVLGLERGGEAGSPPGAVSAISRTLDAPRRIWTVVSG